MPAAGEIAAGPLGAAGCISEVAQLAEFRVANSSPDAVKRTKRLVICVVRVLR